MTQDEISDALEHLHLSIDGLAVLVGVDPRSVRRWVRGDKNCPEPAARLIRVMLRYPVVIGYLDEIGRNHLERR